MTPPRAALSPVGCLLLTTFGLGFLRPAPGTWGSAPTCVLAFAMVTLGVTPVWNTSGWWMYHATLAAVLAVFSAACLRFGADAEAHFGHKDPGQVVADETAGQAIPLMFLPAAAFIDLTHAAAAIGIAFLAFRVCDIVKPWPARTLQLLPAGRGILIDDLIAALYAAFITQLLTRFLFA